MAKSNKVFLEGIQKFRAENKKLQQRLREAKESVNAIKTGNIDALVISDRNKVKVYTEETADKTYRILIEKMHEGAVTINEDGTILYSNIYFSNMLDLPLQKVIGSKFKEFIDDSSKERFEAMLRSRKKHAANGEGYIFSGKGKVIPVLMSVNTFSLNHKLVLSIILTDLTIQNKNQEELKHWAIQLEQKNLELESANKNLTSFTYVSSHDLQEPLRKIRNFITVLLEEENKNLSAEGKNYLQRTYETAERMQALIEDLLTYSRTMNPERNFEKTDLTVIVNEVKKDFEEGLQQKKVTIKATHLCEASILRFQFRQLFQNLVSNSLKFSKPEIPPQITITSETLRGSKLNIAKLSSTSDYCHITYTDNGIGFDPQYNDRILEVFQRLHSNEEYPGTGMGLAICKRIVENHNGIITATGELDKGARFDIYIPVS